MLCSLALFAPVVPSAVFAQEVEGGEVMEDEPSAQPEIAPAAKEEAKPGDKAKPPAAGEKESGNKAEAPGAAASPAPEANIPAQEEVRAPYDAVALRGLNKVTARISSFTAPLGTVVRFGNLEIVARRCWRAPPDEQPENAALLEIWELKPGEGPQRIFLGWMFSSSPAISALEHPVYDITVSECTRQSAQEESQ